MNKSIEFVKTLAVGMFCNVVIPLHDNDKVEITCMYLGLKDGNHTFFEGGGWTGYFGYSNEYIEKYDIQINENIKEEDMIKILDEVSNFKHTQEEEFE